MVDLIQILLSSSALILGVIYIIGGLIVNLSLARRGITEYQILKVKYLVVGMVFILNSIGSFVLAAIPAFFLVPLVSNTVVLQGLAIVSIVSGSSLLAIWAKFRRRSSLLCGWGFWFIASVLGAVFPMTVLMKQILLRTFDVFSVLMVIEGLMAMVLVLIGQIYHYSAFYYGHESKLVGSTDPIGMGILTPVRLACDQKDMESLEHLGLPIVQPGVIGNLFLIDETDKEYIVSPEREGGKVFKIPKETIRAIMYDVDQAKCAGSQEKST